MNPQIEDLWKNPSHWKWHLVYRCRQDPRLVVPERHKWMGYTLNFAHRSAFLLAFCILLVAVAPSLAAVRDGRLQDLPMSLAFSLIFIVFLTFIASRVGRQ